MKQKNKLYFEKIINLFLNVFIFVLIILLMISSYIFIQTKVFQNEYSDFFGFSLFEVQTGSMAPEIDPGDWILVKLTKEVKLNDIVTYKLNDEYVTHRVIEAYEGAFITKGDANNVKDEPITKDQVVGRVENVFAHFGIIRKTLFNPTVVMLFVILFFVLSYFIKKDKKEIPKDNKKDPFFILDNIIKRFKKNSKKKVKPIEILDFPELTDEKLEVLAKTNIKVGEVGEEDLDKTMYFRVIPVDLEAQEKLLAEVEDNKRLIDEEPKTLEISEESPNDLANIEVEVIKEAPIVQEEELEIEEVKKEEPIVVEEKGEELTNIKFDLLKNRDNKNVFEGFIYLKEQELLEIIEILTEEDRRYATNVGITKDLMKVYIESKYHNFYQGKETKRDLNEFSVIDNHTKEMLAREKVESKRYKEIKKMASLFTLICRLEELKEENDRSFAYKEELKDYSDKYDEVLINYMTDKIVALQDEYTEALEKLLKELETKSFNLDFSRLKTRKNLYGIKIEHHLKFNKIYSDSVIDKIYNKGIIAENKMYILVSLLAIRLIRDMLKTDFSKKYVVHTPSSLYGKERKFARFLNMIDNNHAKKSVIILLSLKDMNKHKKEIVKAKKEGYTFALVIDKKTKVDKNNQGAFYIADYLFVNKKVDDITKELPFISKDLFTDIIYEDIMALTIDTGGGK